MANPAVERYQQELAQRNAGAGGYAGGIGSTPYNPNFQYDAGVGGGDYWRGGYSNYGQGFGTQVPDSQAFDQLKAQLGPEAFTKFVELLKRSGGDPIRGTYADIYDRVLAAGDDAKRQNKRLDREIRGELDAGLGRAEGAYGRSLGAVGGGHSDALAALEGQGRQAFQDIDRRDASERAGSFQGLAARGLGNTTVVDAMNRRIGEGSDRARQGVHEALGAQRAGLAERRGQAIGQGYAGMADLRMRGTGLRTGYLESISNPYPTEQTLANLYTGTAAMQSQPKRDSLGTALTLAGAAVPYVGMFTSAYNMSQQNKQGGGTWV